MPGNNRSFFPLLEGMRGVAAVLVILRHIPGLTINPFPMSYLAVDLFFVLSGAVIANAYETRLRLETMSFTQFIAARVVRIFPLYLFGCVIGVLSWNFEPVGAGPFISAALFNFFLLPSPFKGSEPFPFDHPAWSLFFDFCAYAVFAVVLSRVSNRLLGLVTLVALALLVCSAMIIGNGLDFGWSHRNFLGGFPRVAFGFTTGVLLWRLRRPSQSLGPWAAAGVLIALTTLLILPIESRAEEVVTIAAALVVVFPLSVFVALHVRLERTWFSAMTALGELSFPLYVLHVPIYMVLKRIISISVPRFAYGAVYLMFAAGLAFVVQRRIDTPMRKRIARSRFFSTKLAGARPHERLHLSVQPDDLATGRGLAEAPARRLMRSEGSDGTPRT